MGWSTLSKRPSYKQRRCRLEFQQPSYRHLPGWESTSPCWVEALVPFSKWTLLGLAPVLTSHFSPLLHLSNGWKLKCQSLSCVRLFATPWISEDCQVPLSMGFPSKNTGVGCHSLLRGSSQPRDQTQISRIAGRFFTIWTTGGTHSLKAREVPFYSWKYTIPTKILGAWPFSDSGETIVLIYTNIVLNLYIVIASVLWYLHLICCPFQWLVVIFLWINRLEATLVSLLLYLILRFLSLYPPISHMNPLTAICFASVPLICFSSFCQSLWAACLLRLKHCPGSFLLPHLSDLWHGGSSKLVLGPFLLSYTHSQMGSTLPSPSNVTYGLLTPRPFLPQTFLSFNP